MSDFVQKANVKRSVRIITTKIADVATLNTLVQGIIDTNAFQCVDHVVAGETHPRTSRGTQSFGIRVIYENPTTLKNMGTATAKASTVAGYTAAAAALVGNTALATIPAELCELTACLRCNSFRNNRNRRAACQFCFDIICSAIGCHLGSHSSLN